MNKAIALSVFVTAFGLCFMNSPKKAKRVKRNPSSSSYEVTIRYIDKDNTEIDSTFKVNAKSMKEAREKLHQIIDKKFQGINVSGHKVKKLHPNAEASI